MDPFSMDVGIIKIFTTSVKTISCRHLKDKKQKTKKKTVIFLKFYPWLLGTLIERF